MRISKAESLRNVQMQGRAKKIDNNTYQYTAPNGDTVIRLHRTDIIRKTLDGKTILNSGGWQTVTTKDRINKFTNARVWQHKGQWTIDGVPFFDGITLPISESDKRKAERESKRGQKLGKRIDAFVRKLDKLQCLPAPSAGDCLFCQIGFSNDKEYPDTSHLASHIEEEYLHGSLIVQALRWAGYRDPGVIYMLANDDLAKGGGTMASQVKRTLRRYLKRKLNLVA